MVLFLLVRAVRRTLGRRTSAVRRSRMEQERLREETEAFVRQLSDEVIGADDFVAAASSHAGGPGS